jgi:glycine dehydrogenase
MVSDAALSEFCHRHIGPDVQESEAMLAFLGYDSLDALSRAAVPEHIQTQAPFSIGPGASEYVQLEALKQIAEQNKVHRSCIGAGYSGTITPAVIQRNILENPGWYTQYTPYQAELAQGRLEALLNFQTMVADLTGLPLANGSLLDEATAAAEAMLMAWNIAKQGKGTFLAASDCHPQTLEVLKGRAKPLGINLVVADADAFDFSGEDVFGVLVQYPSTDGVIEDYGDLIEQAHAKGALVVMAADLLALTLIKAPGEWGADIAVGSTQRFGVPMGFGGPHAAYMATSEAYVRKMPGRIVGVSKDSQDKPAYRLAVQTREQHIKRDKATSNICTAQVLLAIMASMYGVYHGPQGLKKIALQIYALTCALAVGLRRLNYKLASHVFFDTIKVLVPHGQKENFYNKALEVGYNLRLYPKENALGIALDELTTYEDVQKLLDVFSGSQTLSVPELAVFDVEDSPYPQGFARSSTYLTHPVFNTHHSETEMLRYMTWLQSRDLSLAQSMIALGSCTMKLNATTEMLPVTWPEFARMHPFAPAEQTSGYQKLFDDLEVWLADLTGFDKVSLQPNAGSQGEYAGLLVIRAHHENNGDPQRNICLIPSSAHGTNPASAVAAGFKVVTIKCDEEGNIDLNDLRAKAQQHAQDLGALMITYPSTHGVFEESILDVCAIVHEYGGQVYLDGANMNAMVGLVRPGELGADVCHLNLHKTFCIPHGGGGPGMGPIGVAEHLGSFLPGHCVAEPSSAGENAIDAISAAAYGSPSILPITWMYIALMGDAGLKKATQVAILNANYMAKRLQGHYEILFTGPQGLCAHEFIIDCRDFVKSAGIRIDDIAKRLMDYGFHCPTMSWPVAGTLMIEPTESESKAELDRFCEAMMSIREEIRAIEEGRADKEDNVLKGAPHTIEMVSANEWSQSYSREEAAFPLPWLRQTKFWPAVGRVDNPYGDRNLVCSCPSVEEMADN